MFQVEGRTCVKAGAQGRGKEARVAGAKTAEGQWRVKAGGGAGAGHKSLEAVVMAVGWS